jgi:hypothetical protein
VNSCRAQVSERAGTAAQALKRTAKKRPTRWGKRKPWGGSSWDESFSLSSGEGEAGRWLAQYILSLAAARQEGTGATATGTRALRRRRVVVQFGSVR